jgi:4-hydroxybutyrate dehydrogenase
MTTFSGAIHYPNEIVVGPGAARRAGEWAQRLGGGARTRAFVVTDQGVRGAGLLEHVGAPGGGQVVFDAVRANPDEAAVREATRAFKESGAQVIVGVGGGSPLDVAKAVRLAATHDRPLLDFDDFTGGDRWVVNPLPPMVAIPTTAGTGSEVGRAAVIILPDAGRKVVLFAPALLPNVALLDPEMTAGLPRGPTAATGLDALTHCVESFVARGYHPVADAVALRGARMIARALPRVYETPGDLEARTEMLVAASMGAMAFQKGLGASHALAHPLGSECGVHHGHANAICLPHVLRFNAAVPDGGGANGGSGGLASAANTRARLAELAIAMDLGGPDALPDLVESLARGGGLVTRLRDANVPREKLPALAKLALEDHAHKSNPRAMTHADLLALYEAAW